MKLQDIIDAWNNQADEYNQWTELDGDEKVEFTLLYVDHTDEINNYKRALLLLKGSNCNWFMNMDDDDEEFVSDMIMRAESN